MCDVRDVATLSARLWGEYDRRRGGLGLQTGREGNDVGVSSSCGKSMTTATATATATSSTCSATTGATSGGDDPSQERVFVAAQLLSRAVPPGCRWSRQPGRCERRYSADKMAQLRQMSQRTLVVVDGGSGSRGGGSGGEGVGGVVCLGDDAKQSGLVDDRDQGNGGHGGDGGGGGGGGGVGAEERTEEEGTCTRTHDGERDSGKNTQHDWVVGGGASVVRLDRSMVRVSPVEIGSTEYRRMEPCIQEEDDYDITAEAEANARTFYAVRARLEPSDAAVVLQAEYAKHPRGMGRHHAVSRCVEGQQLLSQCVVPSLSASTASSSSLSSSSSSSHHHPHPHLRRRRRRHCRHRQALRRCWHIPTRRWPRYGCDPAPSPSPVC